MKTFMKVVKKDYHPEARLHVFGVRIVQVSDDGRNITEGPIQFYGNHRKNIDEEYGGSWKKWLQTTVKEELLDHWHNSHNEAAHAEFEQILKEEL